MSATRTRRRPPKRRSRARLTLGRAARIAVAFWFATLAMLALAWGLLIGSRAFAGYQDGAPLTYLLIGGAGVLAGLLFGGAATTALAAPRGHRAWLAVLAASAAAMLLPYRDLLGPVAVAVYVALIGPAALAIWHLRSR